MSAPPCSDDGRTEPCPICATQRCSHGYELSIERAPQTPGAELAPGVFVHLASKLHTDATPPAPPEDGD